MAESTIEGACRRHALAQGIPSKKVRNNVAGDPDRVFLLPLRRVLWVEFKTPVGRLSPRQRIVHAEHAACGHAVEVVRSLAQFKEILALLDIGVD